MNQKDKETSESTAKELTRKALDNLYRLDQSTLHAARENKDLLMRLLRDNQDTEYGRRHGFADIQSVDEYRDRVPFSTYDDYEEYINRMVVNNEKNLITSYPVVYFASTSGTSGSPKKIPLTDRGLSVFQNYGCFPSIFASTEEYYRNTQRTSMPEGKMLACISMSKTILENGVPFGAISAVAATEELDDKSGYLSIMTKPMVALHAGGQTDLKYLHAFFGLTEKHITCLFSPYIPAIVDLMNYIRANWTMLVKDIREGTINDGVRMPDELRKELMPLIKPQEERADEIEKECKEGFDDTIMRRLWPDLSVIAAIWAGNFNSYARKLQKYSGRSMPYYSLTYTSSEGVFGIARHPFDQCYIMPAFSCFFEFIPDDRSGEEDNPKTVLMDELEQGKSYELVITNQSGFYRYRMGDVIKVIGFYNEAPMIVFKYRKNNIVSVAGEKFTEDHLLTAIREFERHTGENIVDFCMYGDTEHETGRYVILLEPEEPIAEEKREAYTRIMQNELARASTSYAHYVLGGEMDLPRLVFLQAETFQLYREMRIYRQGISENQLKTVRVLRTEAMRRFFMALEDK